jgi:hypothetical protein
MALGSYNLRLEVYRLRRGDLDLPTLNVEDEDESS